MDKIIHLRIRSTTGLVLETDATYVDVPMVNSRYGFLYNHAPLIGVLQAGKVRYDVDGKQNFIAIGEGMVKVEDNTVEILVR